jgi:hypothetical protein
MPNRDVDRVFEQVRELAERLTAEDRALSRSQLADQLLQTGIDPDALKSRFHLALKAVAARERAAGRAAPLSLQQAIEQTAPEDSAPTSQKMAEKKMERWIERFGGPYTMPDLLEAARAYRKSGDVSQAEQAELDEFEQQLKESIAKENEGDS